MQRRQEEETGSGAEKHEDQDKDDRDESDGGGGALFGHQHQDGARERQAGRVKNTVRKRPGASVET